MKITTAGYFDAQVAQAAIGESTNGTPQISLLFVAEGGDNIRAYRYFSDKVGKDGKSTAERSVNELKEAFPSWNGDFTAVTETGLLPALEGLDANIKVEEETYLGKPQFRVSFINAPGGGGNSKALADKSILRQLSAMAGFSAPVGAPPAAAATAQVPAAVTKTADTPPAADAAPEVDAYGMTDDDQPPF